VPVVNRDRMIKSGGNYTRGGGNIRAQFIFDKSLADDPHCVIEISA